MSYRKEMSKHREKIGPKAEMMGDGVLKVKKNMRWKEAYTQ
jgi:hypothetical protein